MTEREKILARVRDALKKPAPLPGSHGEIHLPASGQTRTSTARQWLPKVEPGFNQQMALFQKNAADLKAGFQSFASPDELKIALIKVATGENWKRVAGHRGEFASPVLETLSLPICWTDKNYDVQELETCDAGISECDALIAQTGSVLVTNRSAGGRALSVLTPHHVVIARREQLRADLPDAFAFLQQKYAGNYPSMISFITGPSRTSDIERILVLGAHGPKKLTIFCL